MQWYVTVLRKYAVFTGRARRSEYWYFALFTVLIGIGLSILDMLIGTFNQDTGAGLLASLYNLAVFVPTLAVTVRRLHDTARSGWWVLVGLVPCIGFFVLLFFTIQEGTAGENDFGADPKGA